METAKVASYCHIKNRVIYLDGEPVFESREGSLSDFLKSAFKNFKVKYPKYYKMDSISKLSFLCAEALLSKIDCSKINSESIGVVLSNAESTLQTDTAHQQSITNRKEYFPSPAVFVYTLPNIMIGEISIRHKLRGENAFFIFDRFNADFISDYVNLLLKENKIAACLVGWVDLSEENYEAFMYWVDNSNVAGKVHNGSEVNKMYDII